jgi:hypothetical protein
MPPLLFWDLPTPLPRIPLPVYRERDESNCRFISSEGARMRYINHPTRPKILHGVYSERSVRAQNDNYSTAAAPGAA